MYNIVYWIYVCRLTRVLNFWVRRFNDLGPIIKGCLGGASNTFCTKISSSSSRLSPQGGSGRVVSTPLSTVFYHQLYSDPPLCHHLEHNPSIAFSVALSSLFPSPCVPLTIWQTPPFRKNIHGQSEIALNKLGWKLLDERRSHFVARLKYKITYDLAPKSLTEIFRKSNLSNIICEVLPLNFIYRNQGLNTSKRVWATEGHICGIASQSS